MAEYRIEDLARATGATVRNIRAYQDRGLLPKPRRRGRANVYDDAHLTRLRQIAGLLDRGHTLAGVKELLEAWDSGRGLGGLLDLLAETGGPATAGSGTAGPAGSGPAGSGPAGSAARRLTREQVRAMFGGTGDGAGDGGGRSRTGDGSTGDGDAGRGAGGDGRAGNADAGTRGAKNDGGGGTGGYRAAGGGSGDVIAEAVALGVLEPDGEDAFAVPNPQLLFVAAELHAAGVPLTAISGNLRELRAQVEHIARRFLDLTTEHLLRRCLERPPAAGGVARRTGEAADLARGLRPPTRQGVDTELARALRAVAAHRLRQALDAPVTEPGRRDPAVSFVPAPHGAPLPAGTGTTTVRVEVAIPEETASLLRTLLDRAAP